MPTQLPNSCCQAPMKLLLPHPLPLPLATLLSVVALPVYTYLLDDKGSVPGELTLLTDTVNKLYVWG